MTVKEQILVYVAGHPGCLITDILDYTKIHYQMTKEVLKELTRLKQIYCRKWWIKSSFDQSTWRYVYTYSIQPVVYVDQPTLFDTDEIDSAV